MDLKKHDRYLTEREAQSVRVGKLWRAASRVTLSVLLAEATFQLYLMHVYATIAALPTLGLGALQ